MATRGNYPENWSPVPQRITTRPATHSPKDARTSQISERALRPKPLNLPSKQPLQPSVFKSAQTLRKASSESYEALKDPEVIDLSTTTSWERRGTRAQPSQRVQSPGAVSDYSGRQSEISLGILEYYIRGSTPTFQSPELPPPTPKLDPAIDKFDFGLPPTPTPCNNVPTVPGLPSKPLPKVPKHDSAPVSAPTDAQSRPSHTLNRGYSLFPIIKEVTPPPRLPAITHVAPVTLRDITPTSVSSVSSIPSHPHSDPIHRPRKESISSSVRTRNDSINSYRAKQRYPIPLRILSSDSTNSTSSHRRLISTSTATTSPPSGEPQSRWSDDTITSPSFAPTPGPRTSFGSLLRRDSQQYPACFFEDDDDETAPLRKKWAWKKSTSLAGSADLQRHSNRYVERRWDDEDARRTSWWKFMLCGCGGR